MKSNRKAVSETDHGKKLTPCKYMIQFYIFKTKNITKQNVNIVYQCYLFSVNSFDYTKQPCITKKLRQKVKLNVNVNLC